MIDLSPPKQHFEWMRVTPVAYKIEQSVMGQKMCFIDSYVLLGWEQIFKNNFHYFSQTNAKVPIPAM